MSSFSQVYKIYTFSDHVPLFSFIAACSNHGGSIVYRVLGQAEN